MSFNHRRGFTLIEMLIVGSLIVLFAGLAIFAAQEMFESNKKKAVMDEVKSVGTALSAARQDVGFYPRIHLLGRALEQARFQQTPVTTPPTYVVLPGFDSYGFYTSGAAGVPAPNGNPVFAVNHYWKAPYMRATEVRKTRVTGRRAGLVKVRLSDAEYQNFTLATAATGEDASLVDWPTDPWGNPYALYHVSIDATPNPGNPAKTIYQTTNNPKGMRLIIRPTEEANYFNAVVSYGPNRVPGGTDKNNAQGNQYFGQAGSAGDWYGFPTQSLFVEGDMPGKTGADFTLKSVTALAAPYKLYPHIPAAMDQLAQSLECNNTRANYVGVFDEGSDDIFFKF